MSGASKPQRERNDDRGSVGSVSSVRHSIGQHNHIWFQTGMLISTTSGRAYYWRQCDICGLKEYRDQNEKARD